MGKQRVIADVHVDAEGALNGRSVRRLPGPSQKRGIGLAHILLSASAVSFWGSTPTNTVTTSRAARPQRAFRHSGYSGNGFMQALSSTTTTLPNTTWSRGRADREFPARPIPDSKRCLQASSTGASMRMARLAGSRRGNGVSNAPTWTADRTHSTTRHIPGNQRIMSGSSSDPITHGLLVNAFPLKRRWRFARRAAHIDPREYSAAVRMLTKWRRAGRCSRCVDWSCVSSVS